MSLAPESQPLPVAILDLAKTVAHNGAELSGKGPVTIVTPPGQWSYAAAFRYSNANVPEGARLLIRAEITVKLGRIGVIFVTDALNEILGGDEERSAAEGDTVVELTFEPAPASGWLIIRNNASGNTRSACTVRSAAVYALKGRDSVTGQPSSGPDIFERLRQKWVEVPFGLLGRRKTTELLALDSVRLRQLWTEAGQAATAGDGYSTRGWYQDLYRDALRGKKVLDVGSGLGFDGISFAQAGAHVTFMDIVPSNLEMVRRLCDSFQIKTAKFFYLHNLDSLDELHDSFDAIWCQGSMINMPFDLAQSEAQRLLEHLPVGGRWIELAYPRERWERDGSPPAHQWGKLTDGAATPWMEWYDLTRLLQRLQPAEFDVILSFNFHNDDFNWFDLIRRK